MCSFCQGAGHTRATCPLPGAALLRTLLQQAEYRRGRVSKQEGRSKPKFSPGSFGGLKKKLRLAYSGKKKPRTDNLPSASRKCKLFGHRLDCAQQVLEDLVAEGLLRFPKKCLCCRRGRYPRQVLYLPARQRADGQAVFSQGQYVLRCDCCGHRLNTVALGPWGKKFRSKMNLLQLDTFFSEYVRSTSRPLSATTAGRLCQVGLRASRVFLDFFLQKAAEAGFVALLLSRKFLNSFRCFFSSSSVFLEAGRRQSEGRDRSFARRLRDQHLHWYEAPFLFALFEDKVRVLCKKV